MNHHQIIRHSIGAAAIVPTGDPLDARWATETLACARNGASAVHRDTERVPRRVQQTIRRWCVGQPKVHIPVESFWCTYCNRGATGSWSHHRGPCSGPPHTGSEYRRQHCRCEWTNFDPNDSGTKHRPLRAVPADRRTGKHRHKHRTGPNTTGADWYYR